MPATNETRGIALRVLREAKPWTQAQLAQAAGLSTRTVMRAEAGGDASAETLMALCSALGIDAASLPREESTGGEDISEAVSRTPVAEPSPSPRRAAWASRLPFKEAGRVGLLVTACLSVVSVTRGAVITTGLAGSVPVEEIIERDQAERVAATLRKAGNAVAAGKVPDGATWKGLAGNREVFGFTDFKLACQRREFLRVLFPVGARCSWDTTGFVVRAAGPDLYEAAVGPLGEVALREMSAILPKGSRIRVRVAYGRELDAPPEGLLWIDPTELAPGQGAIIPKTSAYAYVRLEPIGAKP